MKAFAKQNGLPDVEYQIYSDKDVESGNLHFTEDNGMAMTGIGVEPESFSRGIYHLPW